MFLGELNGKKIRVSSWIYNIMSRNHNHDINNEQLEINLLLSF
jgi:hypothetical protein